MEKLLILTDTACDIPQETAEELGIRILPIPLEVDGMGYLEGVDFTKEEFYDVLNRCVKIPTTSHIPAHQFLEEYERAAQEGYTHVIHVTINSKGSNMYQAALQAKALFQEEPDAPQIKIKVIDSKTYSLGYGFPVTEAARMVQKGVGYAAVRDYLLDWFDTAEVYFSVYTLQFAKKSGRISCAAAFVGELLGLRPILQISQGEMNIVEKVRGDANVIPGLCRWAEKRMAERSPFVVISGELDAPGDELTEQLEKKFRYGCSGRYKAGASIAINAGPKVVGVLVKGAKKR